MQEWHSGPWQEYEQAAEEVITAVTAELEAAYDADRLDRLARNKGFEAHDN